MSLIIFSYLLRPKLQDSQENLSPKCFVDILQYFKTIKTSLKHCKNGSICDTLQFKFTI